MRFLCFLIASFSFFQTPAKAAATSDTAYLHKKSFLGIGGSVGANYQIDSYVSGYVFTGAEWAVSKRVKYALSADLLKFSWAEQTDEYTTKHRYDRARYFSFSNRLNLSGKYILQAKEGNPDVYKSYLELGAGYNLPIFYTWKEFSGARQVKISYPNNFRDFYGFVKFFTTGMIIPVAFSVEYHPVDVVENKHLPNPPKINLALEIPFYYKNERLLVY